ncbi:Cyclin, C-terminal domain [Dillenia turbinata]|uniref:Cyclin, C-terminal domain n=1 Tax=Dillenia turbinata TaxID=194707 RepID=A0AAN8VYF2_9MAGN
MSSQNRRSSVSASTFSSLAKRHASSSSSENLGKASAGLLPHLAKKRPALADVTNQRHPSQSVSHASVSVPKLVLQMESSVLNYLKFEMTAPTTKCFLRRFVRAAQGVNEEGSLLQLECLANYIAELSLLEYSMLCYAPSLIAASAIFLARYILLPSKSPWNSTLQHYTLYQPTDLYDCVKELHRLCLNSHSSSLPAIREKYSQHKYKLVAKKYCPPSIPTEYFHSVFN